MPATAAVNRDARCLLRGFFNIRFFHLGFASQIYISSYSWEDHISMLIRHLRSPQLHRYASTLAPESFKSLKDDSACYEVPRQFASDLISLCLLIFHLMTSVESCVTGAGR